MHSQRDLCLLAQPPLRSELCGKTVNCLKKKESKNEQQWLIVANEKERNYGNWCTDCLETNECVDTCFSSAIPVQICMCELANTALCLLHPLTSLFLQSLCRNVWPICFLALFLLLVSLSFACSLFLSSESKTSTCSHTHTPLHNPVSAATNHVTPLQNKQKQREGRRRVGTQDTLVSHRALVSFFFFFRK